MAEGIEVHKNYKWTVDIGFVENKNEWHFCIAIPSDSPTLGCSMLFGVTDSFEDSINEISKLMKKSSQKNLVL